MNYFERYLITDILIHSQQEQNNESEIDREFIDKYKDYNISDL